ncbi:unnamed protein product [Miscanthus lutarioriparius]|uniref:Homeobox domain-containing protein n=1 Tax=Miscanthus lutarioriparius TaxID=422564 RepID=A0A811S6M0_9POAL|nr:unnamed protein product [Miscanthus lutarioriparius]
MAVHHPHLLDFSPPPNTVAMEAPPPHFDHGQHHLLGLHIDGNGMPVGGGVPHRVLADDAVAAWAPQAAVSLSLYNYDNTAGGSSSLFGHHEAEAQFAVPPAAVSSLALPNHHQLPTTSSMQPFQLRSSKYLAPVQDLLSEFCSLEGDLHAMNKRAPRAAAGNKWDDVDTSSSSSVLWGHPSLSSLDLLELERRKARFLSMVEEVDRRYRRYREQMRAVEVSFEAVAGAGASQVYTRLALRAMSRHFRCLRDALVAQVRALRKAMGERDSGPGAAATAAGATKGDTPRLKVLDQCLRQQREFQHPGTIENYPWRPQRGLPERAVAVLRAWLFEHFLHPYPNDVDKHILARQTGLSRSQVSNWFINARVRLWKPMIEEMYTEEVNQKSDTSQNPSGGNIGGGVVVIKPEQTSTTAAAAIGGDSHFRTSAGNPSSSMISSSILTADGGGGGHLFSNYPSMHGSHGGAVSLTLGLQQQPFASTMMHQHSLMLQGDEQEPVLPYRDLMGSQLLHDFAG